MPRNAQGIYKLPLPLVVSGQTIEATWANETLLDLELAMTNSLDRDDNGNMKTALKIVDGTSAAPGLSFVSEANTGLHRSGPGDFYFSVLGEDYLRITNENGVQWSDDNGTTWYDLQSIADFETYVDDREITAATWNPADNTLTLTKAEGNVTEQIDGFTGITIDGLTTTGKLTAADGLEVGAEVNQLSALAAGGTTSKTIDTTLANRWLVDNNTGGGTLTINFIQPVGVRDIGPNYTIEGNVIVTNGASPGAVSLQADGVGVAPDDVLGTVAPLAGSKSLLSYVIHNRGGVYTALFIWSAVS